jgi:N-acetylmuramoyl-L-alanine amidase
VTITRRTLLAHGANATFLLPGAAEAASARLSGTRGHAPQPRAAKPAGPVPLVMLDPGHGGKDPGAIGVTGAFEKHIALAAAHELMRLLTSGGRYRVELTRGDDVFIPLDGRVDIAQRKGAALFVSMHADALTDHAVRGASVYTLASTASDTQSAALAVRENSADRFAGRPFANVSPDVARILASLVRQETRAGSARLQRGIVSSLNQDVPLLQNPARHAAFEVLKAADIPSVLVEMGFMSNQQDEAALLRPEHRARVAVAMKRAVDGYFAQADTVHMAG